MSRSRYPLSRPPTHHRARPGHPSQPKGAPAAPTRRLGVRLRHPPGTLRPLAPCAHLPPCAAPPGPRGISRPARHLPPRTASPGPTRHLPARHGTLRGLHGVPGPGAAPSGPDAAPPARARHIRPPRGTSGPGAAHPAPARHLPARRLGALCDVRCPARCARLAARVPRRVDGSVRWRVDSGRAAGLPGGRVRPDRPRCQPRWPYPRRRSVASVSWAGVSRDGEWPGTEEAVSHRRHIHSSWAVRS